MIEIVIAPRLAGAAVSPLTASPPTVGLPLNRACDHRRSELNLTHTPMCCPWLQTECDGRPATSSLRDLSSRRVDIIATASRTRRAVKLPLSMSKSCFWLPRQRRALPAWSNAAGARRCLLQVDMRDTAIVGHRNFAIEHDLACVPGPCRGAIHQDSAGRLPGQRSARDAPATPGRWPPKVGNLRDNYASPEHLSARGTAPWLPGRCSPIRKRPSAASKINLEYS